MQIFEVFGDLIFRDGNTRDRLRQVSQVVDNVQTRMNNFANTAANVGNSMMHFGSSMINNVSKPILNVIKDSVMLASDLGEAYNVVNVTFGKNAKEVTDWSTTLLEKFGLVQLEAVNYVGSMGAMLKSSGISGAASKEMSMRLVELTGDMSSFYNLGHEEMWTKIRSGIAGETEPLKALGINMSVANLEAYALKEGITASWKEMDQAQQIALRYSYLMEVSSDSQGDFANTSDSLSNQLRILTGKLTKAKTELGEKFLPYVQKGADFVLKLVDKFDKLPDSIQNVIIVLAGLAAGIGPVIFVIGGAITMIAALAAAFSFIGWPIVAVGAILAGLVIQWGAFIGIIGTVLVKTGALQWAFEKVKAVVMAVVSVFKGDMNGAFDLMTKKFGLSKEKATIFIYKIKEFKDNLIKAGGVIKDVSKLLGSIFSGKSQNMIDLLVKKFGYSRKEAENFAKKVNNLRDKIIVLAGKIKNIASDALLKFIDKIKQAAKYVYNHRKEIAQFIEKLVDMGIKVAKAAKAVYNAFKSIKKWGNDTFSTIKKDIDNVVTAFNKVKTAISGVITKIKGIKFPSMPDWFPGFANGVTNFVGGMAIVGEEGPELVRLPKGSDVIPNNQIKNHVSRDYTKEKPVKATTSDSTVININMYNSIKETADSRKVFRDFMTMLKSRGLVIRHA